MSRRSSSPYFTPGRPRVLAHRGLALEVPENTVESFLAAVQLGVTHIETDVHASRDGVAVISHDSVLDRVAGRPGAVSELNLIELQGIDLGGGHGFSSLAQVLDVFPETFFNIDIKSPDAVAPTVRAIMDAGALDRVLVTSFSESRRRAAVRQLPGVATSASGTRFAAALLAGKLGFTPLVRRVLSSIHAVQVPVAALGLQITTPAMIGHLHRAGVEVHIWTINEPAVMHRLLDLGVDGIVTDRADLALEVIAGRGS